MLIGGISPYSKVGILCYIKVSTNRWNFFLPQKWDFFVSYPVIKFTTNQWNLFYTTKVVNSTILKSNPFHQFYHITTFMVAFSHPSGLTVSGK